VRVAKGADVATDPRIGDALPRAPCVIMPPCHQRMMRAGRVVALRVHMKLNRRRTSQCSRPRVARMSFVSLKALPCCVRGGRLAALGGSVVLIKLAVAERIKGMSNHALRRSFIAFHLTLGIVVLTQSLITVLHASGLGGTRHLNVGLAWFAGAEVIAALLFLLPATLRLGAWSLLVIFIAAIAFHALHGEWELTLLVYSAGVILVMVHGSAFGGGSMRSEAADSGARQRS